MDHRRQPRGGRGPGLPERPALRRALTAGRVTAVSHFTACPSRQNQFENGDLDFDGTAYHKDWPNGHPRYPQTFRYLGPFTNGHAYAQIQFETDIAGSEALCNVVTGAGCKAPPIGSAGFYPFWSLTNKQILKGVAGRGVCLWNFGNNIAHVTVRNFGRDAQYGRSDVARYGGTLASKVLPNPALGKGCKPFA